MEDHQEGDSLSVITISKVIYGVTKKLSDNFPNNDIHVEEIKEGANSSFFVKILDTSHEQDFGRRYQRYHSFDIHYFASDKSNTEIFDILEQLYSVMEYIEVDNKLYNGTNMKHEVVDWVLHFFVDYNLHVYKEKEVIPKMQELEQEGLIND